MVLMGNVEVCEGVPPAVASSFATPVCSKAAAHVWDSYIMERSVRRSNHMWGAAETLFLATEEAERLAKGAPPDPRYWLVPRPPAHLIVPIHGRPQLAKGAPADVERLDRPCL